MKFLSYLNQVRVKWSAGTAQSSPLRATPSSLNLTLAQYKFILWLRLNAWANT
jgi:hypothetical protein